MKHTTSHSRSGIFLMEIIIAILFFSIVSALCLQAFVRSRALSKDANALNRSVAITESIAEMIKGADSPQNAIALIQETYPNAASDSEVALLSYDENWEPCRASDKDCTYQVSVICNSFGQDTKDDSLGLLTWSISSQSAEVSDDHTLLDAASLAPSEDDVIYSLDLEVYYE